VETSNMTKGGQGDLILYFLAAFGKVGHLRCKSTTYITIYGKLWTKMAKVMYVVTLATLDQKLAAQRATITK
jgi:hypothetical protein